MQRKSILILIGVVSFSFVARAITSHFYVDATYGSDSYNGYNWGSAKKTIQAGLDLADGDDYIYVAAGEYHERIEFPEAELNKLHGGYPPGGGQRDFNRYVTTIRGFQNGPVVYFPAKPDGRGWRGNEIDGFTIREGTDYGSAGGIYSASSWVIIRNCIIEENYSTDFAGGILIYSGALDKDDGLIIENCIVRNNTCYQGAGGIALMGDVSNLGVYTGMINNVVVTGNSSTSIFDYGIGGVDVIFPANITFTHCTVADNVIDHGPPTIEIPGIRITGIDQLKQGRADIRNSIIWHQDGDDIYVEFNKGLLSLSYSNVEDSDFGAGVIHVDPNFIGYEDYRLASHESGCVDSANAAFSMSSDVEGLSRPKGYGYDMGACEYLYGDFNNDRKVDVIDLEEILNNWLWNEPQIDIAPNGGDGTIDFLDLSLMADSWWADVPEK